MKKKKKAKPIKDAKIFMNGKQLADVTAFNIECDCQPHCCHCDSMKQISPATWEVTFTTAPSLACMLRWLCEPLLFERL